MVKEGAPVVDVDPVLIRAWLTARSITRELPLPVDDRGGFRVDANTEFEICRWVFARPLPGLGELAREIAAPLHFLKLCADGDRLKSSLIERWRIQPQRYVMTTTAMHGEPVLPRGYALELTRRGATTHARVLAPDRSLAASGCATEAAGVFIYDRIETSAAHRRRGLGRAVVLALASARASSTAQQILVATEDGRSLYAQLGWSVYSAYATAAIPASTSDRRSRG